MQLPICAFIAWLTIIVFALIPKRLSTLDFIFLYCLILSVTATSYTYFELNMFSVTVPKFLGRAFPSVISRLITVPLFIMMAVNALQSDPHKKRHWLTAIVILIGLNVFDWMLNFTHVITYHHVYRWHLVGTFVTYTGFIGLSWGITWIFRRLSETRVSQI